MLKIKPTVKCKSALCSINRRLQRRTSDTRIRSFRPPTLMLFVCAPLTFFRTPFSKLFFVTPFTVFYGLFSELKSHRTYVFLDYCLRRWEVFPESQRLKT